MRTRRFPRTPFAAWILVQTTVALAASGAESQAAASNVKSSERTDSAATAPSERTDSAATAPSERTDSAATNATSSVRLEEPVPSLRPIPCARDLTVKPSTARQGAAIAAAVVPGMVVHGLGHWVNGQTCTANRLIAAEAVGLGGVIVGGSSIIFSGASRYLVAPAIPLTIAGFSLVFITYLADFYGVAGVARFGFEPERRRPVWETELGVLRVHNPRFDFEWLATQRVAHHFGRGSIVGALDTAFDGTHAQYRLGGALRLLGPLPHRAARDGSFVDLFTGLREQRYVTDGFVSDSVEVSATGRLDLERIGPTLRGAFAEFGTGVALIRTSYRLDGLSVPADLETMLLGRMAFGAYLGRGQRRGSEASVYYEHRHDDYAAGLKIPGLGSGTIGHFGISSRYFFSKQLGVGVTAEAGSAYVTGLSLLFRVGAEP